MENNKEEIKKTIPTTIEECVTELLNVIEYS